MEYQKVIGEDQKLILERLEGTKNFTLKKIRAKFIVLELLAFMSLNDCLDKFW